MLVKFPFPDFSSNLYLDAPETLVHDTLKLRSESVEGTVSVGADGSTVTLALSLLLPPAPVQVTVTLKLPALDGVYSFVPEVDVEPIPGEPLHAVALVDDQLSSTLSPSVMELSSNSASTSGGA